MCIKVEKYQQKKQRKSKGAHHLYLYFFRGYLYLFFVLSFFLLWIKFIFWSFFLSSISPCNITGYYVGRLHLFPSEQIYLDNDYTRVPVPLICNDNGGGGGRLYSTDRPKTSKLTIHMKNDWFFSVVVVICFYYD